MISNGRDSIGNGSFQVGTTNYSFAFREGPQFERDEWLAFNLKIFVIESDQ